MTFPMPVLDDRSFQDLVDEAKRRIPHHTPEWTDHNLTDPGVALIELFAWMTESIVYRLNQVPDRLYRSFLELVGVTPYAPVAAQTDVTFWIHPDDTGTHTVPAGTQVATTQDPAHGSVPFLTTEPVTIRQPTYIAARRWRAKHDRLEDVKVALDRGVVDLECFPDMETGDAMYFGFREPLTANVLRVALSAPIRGLGIRPEQAPLVWEISVGNGEWAEVEIDPGGDTTSGLNTEGRVLLYLPLTSAERPHAHIERPLDRLVPPSDRIAPTFEHTERLYGERAYWLRVRLTDGTPRYVQSPVIRSIDFQSLGGRAAAEQATPRGREEVGHSTAKPGQTFHLQSAPVRPLNDGETIEVQSPKGQIETWEEVSNFANTEKDDKHFTLDLATGEIRFGPHVSERDGTVRRHGAVPSADSKVFMTGYRSGIGRAGNVAAGTIVVLKSSLPFVQRIENRKAAYGGVDAETVENAKIRGPLSLVTGDRAVTPEDFEHLTRSEHPEVARAKCQPTKQHDEPIRLFIIPRIDDIPTRELTLLDLLPEQALLDKLEETLEERRLIGASLLVRPADYKPVSIVVRVEADAHHRPISVRDRCIAALYDYVHPLTGGPQGDGWPWGQSLTRPEVSKILLAVPGVAKIREVLFFDAEYSVESEYTTPKRLGKGRDQFILADNQLPISAMHQVLVDGHQEWPDDG